MGLWLKQSTAVTVKIGPFIDDTDGKTAETGLTLTQADIRISKNGANIIQKNEANNATTDELGYYDCPIDTTDTDTLGRLQLFVHEAGALPVFHEYMVVPANVWDSMFGADLLQVDVREKGAAALDFTTTEKTSLESAVDAGLDNAIPANPTANSVHERVKAIDLLTEGGGGGDLATLLTESQSHPTLDEIEASKVLALESTLATIAGYLDTEVAAILAAVDTEVAAIKAITDLLTLDAIADAVLDEVVEGTTTLRQSIQYINGATHGKLSGGGTNTFNFRDIADTKNRIVATVDANKDRTAVVRSAD